MAIVSTLTELQKKELAIEAIQAAQELGYCEEATSVLEYMGFDLPDQEISVTIKATVTLPLGTRVDDFEVEELTFSGNYQSYTADNYTMEVDNG